MRLFSNILIVAFAFPLIAIAKPLTAMPTGASFCLSNLADYNQHKSQLPTFLQTTPVWLGADKNVALFWHVIAALKISFRGTTMVLSSDIWNPKDGARYTDITEIRRACFFQNKNSMVVESTNGVFTQSGYTNNQLTVQGVSLSPVSAASHQALIEKVKATNGNRPGRQTPVGVGK